MWIVNKLSTQYMVDITMILIFWETTSDTVKSQLKIAANSQDSHWHVEQVYTLIQWPQHMQNILLIQKKSSININYGKEVNISN